MTWYKFYTVVTLFAYPLINLGLVFAALYAAKNPLYRRPFHCLALAGTLSIFCSSAVLLIKLHRLGAPSFLSKAAMEDLILFHNVAEIGSFIVYAFGFFTLARRIRVNCTTESAG